MRTFSIISSFVLLLATLGVVAPANAQWPQTTAHNPWSLEIGAKAYDRPGAKNASPLITNSVTRETLFDTEGATDLGTAPAAEIKFNFNTRNGQELELRTIIAQWDESSDPFLGPNLESPFFPSTSVPGQINFDHDSDYFSFELMGRRAVRPGIVLMFGPRLVSTKDQLTYRSTTTFDPGSGALPVTLNTSNATEATNILMGLQGGFELNRPITNGIYASSFMRVGGYYNPTEVNFSDSNSITTITNNNTMSKSTGSFLGEVGGRVYMDIVPNCCSGYVGYEANWIDGIALAPAQISPGSTGFPLAVDTANTMFFHGVTFGLKFTY